MNDVKITVEESDEVVTITYESSDFVHVSSLYPEQYAALEAHYRAKFAADDQQELRNLRALVQAISECRDDPASAIVHADRVAGAAILRALAAEQKLESLAAEQPATPTPKLSPEDIAAEYAPFDGSDPDTVIYMRGIIATAIRQDRLSAATPTPSTEQIKAEARAEVLDWISNSGGMQSALAAQDAREHFAAVVRNRDITESHSSDTPNTEQITARVAAAWHAYAPNRRTLSNEFDAGFRAALVSPVSEQPTTGKSLHEAWAEGLDAGRDRWMDAREFGDVPVNPHPEQPTPLDPLAWTCVEPCHGHRGIRYRGPSEVACIQPVPRPEFEQDRARYPEPTTQPGDSEVTP